MTGQLSTLCEKFDDPPRLAAELQAKEETLDCYRKVRDQIKTYIENLPGSLADVKKERL